jgi:peptidoglycan/LPS O-acetylase OafA/YrhL
MTASAPTTAATPPPSTGRRFGGFDGLRALAALAVLVFHAGLYTHAQESPAGLAPYLARLNVGVALFFVISGFLLYRPLLAARAGLARPVALREYARRRLARIVPAYWAALTVLAIYPGLPDIPSARTWIYYLFLQDYSARTLNNGIGPAWSLGCEVVFYALLPLLSAGFALAARRAGRRVFWQLELAGLALLTTATVLYRIFLVGHSTVRPPSTFMATFGWFALGMALALASVRCELSSGAAWTALRRHAWLGWPAAATAYLVLCHDLDGPHGFFTPESTLQQLEVYGLNGVVAAGLALPAVFEPARPGALSRLLAWRGLTWLGTVSYGIYLLHVPIMVKLNASFSTGAPQTQVVLVALATALVATAAAALSYYLIERPALRLVRGRGYAAGSGAGAPAGHSRSSALGANTVTPIRPPTPSAQPRYERLNVAGDSA